MLSTIVLISLLVALVDGFGVDSAGAKRLVSNEGVNFTIPCWPSGFPNKKDAVYWVRDGERHAGEMVQEDGSLYLPKVRKEDTNLYICRRDVDDHIISKTDLYVREPPSPVEYIRLEAFQRCVVVHYEGEFIVLRLKEMGEAYSSVHMKFRPVHDNEWIKYPGPFDLSKKRVDVCGLMENTKYEFRFWYSNGFEMSSEFSMSTATSSEFDSLTYDKYTLVYILLSVLSLLNIIGIVVGCHIHYKIRKRASNKKQLHSYEESSESIEMVPNIVENPNYYSQASAFSSNDSADVKVLLTHPTSIHDNSTFM